MLTRLQQSRIALKTLDMLMQIPSERPQDQDYVRHENLPNSISFENVSFQYPEAETLALHSLNISIQPGEKVGIIGRVGSGKSTLGRLILGLYQQQEGTIKVGDIDIRQLDIADLRRKIGYTAQDGILFYGSIRDNIALGNPFADDRAILQAAHTSGALEFIKTHPAGFGRQVGEGGRNLSGGQRQAVSIARTLLQQPDILVLDEPTNSMDNATESLFRQRLAETTREQTLLLITHRSSMLAMVDRLIVLDAGRIVADGPKETVLEALKKNEIRTS
jgi:ATP-binding cassette subfamily C protein LapB